MTKWLAIPIICIITILSGLMIFQLQSTMNKVDFSDNIPTSEIKILDCSKYETRSACISDKISELESRIELLENEK